ncbi:MAG: PD40 domain-containing protein [Planctomycetes bacterium]|nr:PD40 domain-containing protein [Planctomycetota bacterium]
MIATRAPLALLSLVAACASPPEAAGPLLPTTPFEIRAGKPVPDQPLEKHLRNVRQLTFHGENAEAYWSNDGRKLIYQHRASPTDADQIYILDLATGEQRLVSTGKGRTTCAYFLQGDRRILFGSTHHHGDQPPVVKPTGRGYQWVVHQEYDIFTANLDGSDLRQITDTPGYDTEATVCPVTGAIVFTSVRDGDLEVYTMEPDGSNVRRITNRPGYDGGAFFSHDGSKLVLRSAFPRDAAMAAEDAALLGQQIVRPSHMEITVCKRDGSGFRQVTNNGAANFAPFWTPDDRRILFASNFRGLEEMQRTGNHAAARNFDLFLIQEDGTGLEQVTHHPDFDSFPMFSPDGRHLVFASNRHAAKPGETNIFVAEWID